MGTFDPDTFMSETIDQPLETERTLVPEGEYKARVDDFTRDSFETITFTYKRGPNAGQEGSFTKFNCPLIVDDDKVKAELGQDKVLVFYSITLDFDQDGKLAWGKNKNIDLGKLRKATGQNQAGPWAVGNLRGAGPFMVKVEHRSGKRNDGSEWKRAEVSRLAPIV